MKTLLPLLWVVPHDVFRVSNPLDIGPILAQRFKCDHYLIDDGRALCLSFPEIQTDQGRSENYPLFLELMRPLFQSLDGFLHSYDALDFKMPRPRFWTRMLLQSCETEKNFCMYMLSEAHLHTKLAVRVFSHRALSEQSLSKVREFLLAWLDRSRSNPVQGEVLRYEEVRCERYQRPETTLSYPRHGFAFRFKSFEPAYWPWLELYLVVRRTFPKRERLSFEFFDEDAALHPPPPAVEVRKESKRRRGRPHVTIFDPNKQN